SPACDHVESPTNLSMGPQGESEDRVLRTGDSSYMPVSQERHATRKPAAEESGCGANKPLRSKRTSSCPPEVSRSVISGPW
ncbi:hypothetical protein A2U01_0092409, partial [Trifolium medium]|nr:hypothetical protein [Trifolium medium]